MTNKQILLVLRNGFDDLKKTVGENSTRCVEDIKRLAFGNAANGAQNLTVINGSGMAHTPRTPYSTYMKSKIVDTANGTPLLFKDECVKAIRIYKKASTQANTHTLVIE